MKTVFKSDEIAHIWANRGAHYGRSPGNASFDGDAFKSYQTVIGRRITAKGKTAYVLDQSSFSVSTSRTQRRLGAAIRTADKEFHVHCGSFGQSLNFTPATLRDYYLGEFRTMGEGKPARMHAKKAEALLHRFSRLESAIEVCAFFKLPTKKMAAQLRKAGPDLKAAQKLVMEYRDAKRVKREAKLEAERVRREIREGDHFAQAIATAEAIAAGTQPYTGKEDFGYHWSEKYSLLGTRQDLKDVIAAKAAEFESTKLTRWQNGEDVSLPHDCPTMLRAEYDHVRGTQKDGEMVTSHGARVPLEDARRTYRFALLVRAKGWHKNGETHAIGSYQLDAVNENGVVAGCHRVSWAEIERFATTQGWNTQSEAAMNARTAGDRALSL